MKNTFILICCGISLFICSCVKDQSNYQYSEKEQITVSGLEPSYTKISDLEKIAITPEVASTDANAEFEYLWGIYETNVQGSAPVLDTIGRTKNLDYLVKQPAKTWVLVFRVTNKNTGYAQYFTSNVNVVTQYTRGWYVAKDDGTQTDLDLFLTPTGIIPEGKVENVYSLANGRKLDGQAQIMNFFTAYKSTVTGSLGNTRALFIVSGKDVSAVNINTLKEIRGFNTLFYEPPATKSPDLVCIGSSANYIVNDGQCHSIYAMSANTGQFGVAKMKDDNNTPYHLSSYFLTSRFTDPYFFDEISSSFLSATGTGATMVQVSDAASTDMPANNNNKQLLFMGLRNYYPLSGFAVFQDRSDPSLKILSEIIPSRTAFTLKNDTLKNSDQLFNASRYALLDGDENMLYFSVGNQVWSRNLTNKFEQLQFTAGAGEEITFIRHRKYTSESAYAYNYVMIGSRSGNNYKVRMFTKSSGNLAAAPDVTLEGTGTVKDVMYISPSVSEATYNNTY